MLLIALSHLLALVAIVLAFIVGEDPEKRAGFVILLMLIFGDASKIFIPAYFFKVDIVAFIDDMIGLVGFSLIAILGNRIWPLWAAAFQLLSVGAHFVRALAIPVRPLVYAWMKSGPTWAVLALLILGTLLNRRARRDRENARCSPN